MSRRNANLAPFWLQIYETQGIEALPPHIRGTLRPPEEPSPEEVRERKIIAQLSPTWKPYAREHGLDKLPESILREAFRAIGEDPECSDTKEKLPPAHASAPASSAETTNEFSDEADDAPTIADEPLPKQSPPTGDIAANNNSALTKPKRSVLAQQYNPPWSEAADPIIWAESQTEDTLWQLQNAWQNEKAHSIKDLTRGFGVLLSHYLDVYTDQSGDKPYPAEPRLMNPRGRSKPPYNRDTAEKLSTQIAFSWQDPERSIPYDALLVGSWLAGENLPTQAAWDGIRHYLESCITELDKETAPQRQAALDTMDALYAAITERQHLRQQRTKTRKAVTISEAQQILYLRWQLTGIPFKEITKDMLPSGAACIPHGITLPYGKIDKQGKPTISFSYCFGQTQLNPASCCAFDHLLEQQNITQPPSLTEIYWHDTLRQAQQRWEEANTLGQQLDVLLAYTQSSHAQLAQAAGVSNPAVSFWLRDLPYSHNHNLSNCPSPETLEQMIDCLRDREQTLREFYCPSAEPFITDARIQQLRSNHRAAYKPEERRVPVHARKIYDDALLAEMVVLRDKRAKSELTYEAIAKLYGISHPQTVTYALKKARNRFGDDLQLSNEERSAAETRIRERLAMKGDITTHVGAYFDDIPNYKRGHDPKRG